MFFVLYYFVCLTIFITVNAKNEVYKGSKVYHVRIESQQQQQKFGYIINDQIDLLRTPSYKHNVVGRAMVPSSHLEWFEEKLHELGIPREVAIEDVYQYLTEIEKRTKIQTISGTRQFGFDSYYRYDEILEYINVLQESYANSTINIKIEQYGTTEQNRPLIYLKVESDINSDIEKPVVIVEAGINPRDWITVPAALHIVNKLLENETQFLDESVWIIVPVLNPDGYEYTHTNLRLWTKSLSTKSDLTFICPGVNINRNFDPSWQKFASSTSACSHIYSGINPFSEIETQMIRFIIETYGRRTRLYISLQNYGGGFISYPWQYERAASAMFVQHHLLGLKMADAMTKPYKVDVGFEVLGDRVSGTSTDFVHQKGVLYPFTVHIDEEDDGVHIPEENIVDVINDVWKAVEIAAESLV